MTYNYSDLKFPEISLDVWREKYKWGDEQTPEDTMRRVANALEVDPEPLVNFEFVPAGRILAGAGTDRKVTWLNCFASWTKFVTKEYGLISFLEAFAKGEQVHVRDANGSWVLSSINYHRHQPLYKLTLTLGATAGQRKEIYTTKEHRWFTSGLELQTHELLPGMLLDSVPRITIVENEDSYQDGIIHGLIYGDGSYKSPKRKEEFQLRLCGEKKELLTYFKKENIQISFPSSCKGDPVIYIKSFLDLKSLPQTNDSDYLLGFFRGWFATDGSIYFSGRKKSSINISLCIGTQQEEDWLRTWLPSIGIFPQGSYMLPEITNYGIRNKKNRNLRLSKYSLLSDDFLRSKHSSRFLESYSWWKVESVTALQETAAVFCLTVPSTHSFMLDENILTGNCAVLPEIEDSMEGIADSVKQLMLWLKAAQGVGTDFSSLRPANTPLITNEGAIASGPLSFMQLWDTACRTIMSGGARRGALMGTMRCDHPDIENFIIAKRTAGNLTQFNLSVLCTDAFMQRVRSDLNWNLQFNGVVYKTIRARDLWELIMRNTYEFAEPGVIFIDTIQHNHRIASEKIITTNPCLAEGTLVTTPGGYIPIEKLNVGDIINTVIGPRSITSIEVHDEAELLEVEFTNGVVLHATPAHIFHSRKPNQKTSIIDKETRLSDLVVGDHVRLDNSGFTIPSVNPEKDWLEGFLNGVLLGDGCVTKSTPKIAVGKHELDWLEVLLEKLQPYFTQKYLYEDRTAFSLSIKAASPILIPRVNGNEKSIPLDLINSSDEFALGLLSGYFSTDGNINVKKCGPQIRACSQSKELVRGIQLLLRRFGVDSRIYSAQKVNTFIDGREVKFNGATHTLVIFGSGIHSFINKIKVAHPTKTKQLNYLIENYFMSSYTPLTKIKRITPIGKGKVFDLYEKESDTWVTEGIVSRGCGEIPLPAFGVCCLGAVNLLACIDEPFTKNATINYSKLDRAILVGIDALNSVIDKTPYACLEQEEVMKLTRRIGLGIMGLGSACNALGRDYLSGAKYLLSAFIDLVEMHRKQPITTTIAPTGNTGVFAKNVSGGIEPVFALEYKRNKRLIDGGNQEYTVRDASVELLYNVVPENETTFNEHHNIMRANVATNLSPKTHLKVQAYAQRFIDNSISKTINCPVDISYEDFKNIYMKAYELGCKGCTTYRPNDVRGAVLETIEKEPTPKPTQPTVTPASIKPSQERPEILDGVTAKFFWPPHERAYYITVGAMADLPYECFINSKSVNSELIALARLISAQFRRGRKVSDIAFVWEELQQVGGNDEGAWVNGKYHKSLVAAIGSIVEQLADNIILEDDDEVEVRIQEEMEYERENVEAKELLLPQCPKCGQYAIVSEAGCKKCLSCGDSKCS